MTRLEAEATLGSGARRRPLAPARVCDQVLAALLALWAALSLLPFGVWTGVADGAFYAETWTFWASALLLAALATGLVVLLSHGAAATLLRRALARAVACPTGVFLVGVGTCAVAEAAAVSAWGFARNPQSIDGWVQWFQARIFLTGRLTAPSPPSVEHFATLHMLLTDRGWFAQFPPLHAALVALGMAAGGAWLVTPLLTGLLPAALHRLGRQTGDERIARTAAVLPLLSPFVATMAASGMNHIPAALCIAVGLAAISDVARGRTAAGAVLGAATGLCLGLRPLDATVLAAVGGAAVAVALARRAWLVPVAVAGAGLVAALPTFLFNAATTGHPLRFAYLDLWGSGLELGLGHDTPWGDVLTPARALGLTAVDAHQMNVYLLEWPLPVTAVVALGCWLRRGALGSGLRAPAAYLLGLVGGLFLYFHRDTLYGPRLLFSALPPLFVLLAAALVRITGVRRPLGWRGVVVGDAALVGVFVVAIIAGTLLVPGRMAAHATVGTSVALHPDRDAADAGIHHAVVVMREGWGPRLIARMWAAGVPMRETSRLYRAFDACTLQTLLDTADAAGVRDEALRAELAAAARTADPGVVVPDVVPDRLVRLPRDGRVTPVCAAEIERDRGGTMQFAAYLSLDTPGLDGDVVWARDMGERNAALRRLWPDRPLYRYEPSTDGRHGTFVRLDG